MTQSCNQLPISPRQAAECCGPIDGVLDPEWFKAMGDPTRIQLLGCLMKCGRPCSVGEMAECCAVDLSVVSRHLRVLQRAGLLDSTKHGRTVSYQVRYGAVCRTLRHIADAIQQCCPQQCCGDDTSTCATCCQPR